MNVVYRPVEAVPFQNMVLLLLRLSCDLHHQAGLDR